MLLAKEDIMKSANLTPGLTIASLLGMCMLAGCGGTKVLNEPQPIQTTRPLATVSDRRVSVTLDWVIVRDGPGTWAKNADWDEYLLRVSNVSDQRIRITRLIVVDSLETRIESLPGRKQLVKGSKYTARRYRNSGLKVKAGRGAGTMLVAGAAVTAVGVSAASAVAYGSFMSGAAAGTGSAGAAASGLLLLGPAIAVGGIVRAVNNGAVNKQIEQRQTILPIEVSTNDELMLDVFFPLAPSPRMIELTYADAAGEHSLIIDTITVLDGLHLDAPTGVETQLPDLR
ncbi:MAG: hypothetical protein ACR2QI_00800 [Woeseiaceae bacterium]